jgi:WD40 repeat protein
MDEMSIFQTALAKVDPHERSAYLSRACGGDAALRRRIEEALEEATDVAVDPTQVEVTPAPALGVSPLLPFLAPPRVAGMLGRLGPYDIVDILGRGGMGVVLKAYDPNLRRFVALKVLTDDPGMTSTARRRFDREAQAVASIHHDNVVGIYGISPDHDPPYFVMPFIEGRTLQELLDRQTPFSIDEIVRIGREAAAGLAAAHKGGVVHRDVKPANILIEEPGGRVKITDFGLARGTDDVALTTAGLVAGTPLFMSPEQAHGVAIDGRSDLFSLGGVLYTLCTGRPPFRGVNPVVVLRQVCDDEPPAIRSLNPNIPEWLVAIVMRLLEKDREQRFQSAQEVADLLSRPHPEEKQPEKKPVPRSAWQYPWLVSAALCSVLLALFLPALAQLWLGRTTVGAAASPIERLGELPVEVVPLALRTCPADSLRWERIPRSFREFLGRWDQAEQSIVAVLSDTVVRPLDVFSAAAYRPDGGVVAVGGYTGDLCLVDASTGATVSQCAKAHGDQIRCLAYRPDGQRLASGGFDGIVKIWDPAGLRLLREIRASGHVCGLTYTNDGKQLLGAVETSDRPSHTEVWAWDPDNGLELRHADVSPEAPHALALHPAGKLLAVAGYDRMIRLLDPATLKTVREPLQGHSKPVFGLAFSRDGRWLYSCGDDSTVRTWDVKSGYVTATLTAPDRVISLTTLGDGILAACCVDGKVLLCDPANGQELRRLTVADESLRFVLASPDGRTLLVGGWGGTLSFRDPATQRERHRGIGHRGTVHGVAFSPDGSLVATCGQDRSIVLWDAATGQERRRFLGHQFPIGDVTFSPDGKRLASGALDRSVRIWDVETGNLVRTLSDKIAGGIPSVAYNSDGSLLAAGTFGGYVHVWTSTGQSVRTWKVSEKAVWQVAFCTDGSLGTVSDSGLRLWNPRTGEPGRSLATADKAMQALAFDPAGQLVAGAGADGRIRLWDVSSGALMRDLPGPASLVVSLAFRADGQLLVAYAPLDGTVQWWGLNGPRARTGSLHFPPTRSAELQRMSLSPEGRHVAIASPDVGAYLLRLAPRGEEPPFDP